MTRNNFQIINNGDSAITIMFNEPVDEHLSLKINQLMVYIKQSMSEKFENIIPAYQSLTLCYKPLMFEQQELKQRVKSMMMQELPALINEPALVEIPVCYDDEFATDMERVLNHTGLSRQELIATHSGKKYLVHMLGFMPGFLYLGGLDTHLACPRKSTPAIRIPEGAVAIGGNQTGVYPVSSPGGWNIIGRTPLSLFKPDSQQPFIASAMDKIRFVPVTKEQFTKIKLSDEVM